VARKSNASACASPCECASGFCADGVCCDSTCTSGCAACNLAGRLGLCSNHTVGTDPENACGNAVCSGAGACFAACSGVCSSSCKVSAFCSGTSCAPDKADGLSCSNACECTSGSCSVFFVDADRDGFGTGSSVGLCGANPPTGYARVAGDCCDTDNRANPNGAFESTARAGCGGFDFDCSGSVEQEFDVPNGCNTTGSCATQDLDCPGSGWTGSTVPACGASASYTSCTLRAAPASCGCGGCTTCITPSTSIRTQRCR
jgi:hypothetical protein